ncbi:hypothetical protein [Streptomyces milbemycinicus]|uniref:hypothetical protein n=1 Tax=Streptomyces milbemycinicus TaxID=476552 RepID=UPI0033C2258C
MSPKSFYELVFSVAPGAARKDAHYVVGSLDEVKRALDSELSASTNVYLLCWHSTKLVLNVYERGECIHSINLHPYITVSVDGYPDITFLESGKPTGYEVGADDPYKVETALSDGMFSGELDDAIEVTVDWASVEVPPLVGEIAVDGDYVKLVDHPSDDDGYDEGYEDDEDFDEDDFDEDELEDEFIERGYVPYGFTDFEE